MAQLACSWARSEPTIMERAAMPTVTPTDATLGATIEGIDLSKPLSPADRGVVLRAFAEHAVLCFPRQSLEPPELVRFSNTFGSCEVSLAGSPYSVPGHPEVMLLSNVVENGRVIGLADAGQDWHTEMSYSKTFGFINVLFAVKVPVRDGAPLGATEFLDVAAAYDDLPAATKSRIEGLTATHDLNGYWEKMRQRPGTQRKPLTPEQRAAKPPVSHPMVLRHPISGRKSLYCNVGFTDHIDNVSKAENDELLGFLFAHQMQDKYKYVHRWSVGDVLAWDNLWTMHNAVGDYRADEPRLMRRCQVKADWIFTPEAKAAAAVA
jgi:taurine dioxygenase